MKIVQKKNVQPVMKEFEAIRRRWAMGGRILKAFQNLQETQKKRKKRKNSKIRDLFDTGWDGPL